MRGFSAIAGSTVFIVILAALSSGQIPPQDPSTSQIRKEFVMGRAIADGIERRDRKLDDAPIAAYLLRVSNRVAAPVGKKPLEIRVTRSSTEYAHLLPGTLYISGALLERIENEAELAGLFAHQLAHGSGLVTHQNAGSIPLMTAACVLTSPLRAFLNGVGRDAEIQATKAAVDNLKLAGYDPLAVLELLSKLSYEHPAWSKAIVPDDLLNLRVMLEQETMPPAGYAINSSDFIEQHARLLASLGHARNLRRPTLEPSKIR